MITFERGPANGKTLALRRAPFLLRVVINQAGAVDALDQLDDDPTDDERVVVYWRKGEASTYHLNCGRRRGSGWYQHATYVFLPTTNADAKSFRDRAAWQRWATERASRPIEPPAPLPKQKPLFDSHPTQTSEGE